MNIVLPSSGLLPLKRHFDHKPAILELCCRQCGTVTGLFRAIPRQSYVLKVQNVLLRLLNLVSGDTKSSLLVPLDPVDEGKTILLQDSYGLYLDAL